MPDKTVSIVNGIVRVNGIGRGRIIKRRGLWVPDPDLRRYLNFSADFVITWFTRKAAADWVKDRLTNR